MELGRDMLLPFVVTIVNMSLPDDVLDHIFGFLQSDFHVLKACSQSHPKFIPLVKRHLYANIALYIRSPSDTFIVISGHRLRTAEFISLLSNDPYITNYIRRLEVNIIFCLPLVTGLENMASILSMCSLVKTVTFTSRYTTWLSLPENFRLAVLNCLNLPSMRSVSIILVYGFPLAALSSSKSVKSLTLCDWTPGPGFIPETSRHPLLEHLAIQDCSCEAVQTIMAWVKPGNLRSLEITPLASHNVEQLSKFYSSCSNTLTDLSLDIKSECKSLSFSSWKVTSNLLHDSSISIPVWSRPCWCG